MFESFLLDIVLPILMDHKPYGVSLCNLLVFLVASCGDFDTIGFDQTRPVLASQGSQGSFLS